MCLRVNRVFVLKRTAGQLQRPRPNKRDVIRGLEPNQTDKLRGDSESEYRRNDRPSQVADPRVWDAGIFAGQWPESDHTPAVETGEQRQARKAEFGAHLQP